MNCQISSTVKKYFHADVSSAIKLSSQSPNSDTCMMIDLMVVYGVNQFYYDGNNRIHAMDGDHELYPSILANMCQTAENIAFSHQTSFSWVTLLFNEMTVSSIPHNISITVPFVGLYPEAKFSFDKEIARVKVPRPRVYVRQFDMYRSRNVSELMHYKCSSPFILAEASSFEEVSCIESFDSSQYISQVQGDMNHLIPTSIVSSVILLFTTFYILRTIVFVLVSK